MMLTGIVKREAATGSWRIVNSSRRAPTRSALRTVTMAMLARATSTSTMDDEKMLWTVLTTQDTSPHEMVRRRRRRDPGRLEPAVCAGKALLARALQHSRRLGGSLSGRPRRGMHRLGLSEAKRIAGTEVAAANRCGRLPALGTAAHTEVQPSRIPPPSPVPVSGKGTAVSKLITQDS